MTKNELLFPCLLVLGIAVGACSKHSKDDAISGGAPGSSDGVAANYADEKMWLCLPTRDDSCSSEPAVNELLADGSFKAVEPEANPDDSVDCFYVHPTSDLSVKAGNSENFEYLEPVQRLAQMQVSPFHGSCRIFAPLYHQITIGTYALPESERQPYIERAEADVRNAFDYYMANYNGGRKIVLIGHSQGSEMLALLMKERFDPVPAMRSQLLLAILPGYVVRVPIGAPVGASFANIPACTKAGEVGCVISFRSYKEGTIYLGDGDITLLSQEEELCVNPATLDDTALTDEARRTTRSPLKGSLFPPPSWIADAIRDVASPLPFVLANTAYSAACAPGLDPRNRFLSIEENLPDSDPRHGLALLDSKALTGLTGLHVLDMQFPMAELVALVRARR